MEHIIHNFAQGSLFACTEQLFKQLNIKLHSSEDLPILPQNFFDEELYKPANKIHQLIQQLYVAGMVGTENDSLAVIAVELAATTATRTQLSTITRLINRQAKGMPVAVLFKYGNHIALANAERTQYKQTYREGEKIGKVSILKDIDTLNPHRGHLDILETLKIPAKIKTFRDLYAHWQEVFNVSTLNKKFYNELFAWFQWTISEEVGVTYPNDTKTNQDDRVQLEEQVIRLITRVLFVWFIKQKHLVPNNLFEEAELSKILKDFDPNSLKNGNYYNAILQNLFFATLNKKVTERAFATASNTRDIKTLYRYKEIFKISEEEVIELFKPIPFLNGGLFECLDKDQGNDGKRYHLDGFSRNDKRLKGRYIHRAFLPNIVFFDPQKGLFPLLNRYHFTIEENTPNDIQVALDPELLGNVFENLLGAFNPETQESARKQSGSFYTPKEVVNYMVDESLKTYLKTHLPTFASKLIDELFEEQDLTADFDDITKHKQVAECLRKVKILDPACGSGAFPMGILNRMVYILEKLGVDTNETTYQLKRHLIEKCIYGVDIQTIAAQISKLRFFISLILEQTGTNTDPALNYGIQPLPNLETKFVTANTLIAIREKKGEVQGDLFESSITTIKEELIKIREAHFEASSPYQKKRLREQDRNLREELIQKLQEFGEATPHSAKQFAEWDPYDQNASAPFFDPEWMFGISDGFDIVIGNPPYVQLQKSGGKLAKQYEEQRFQTFARTGDIYCLFYEKAYQLLKQGGICNFITSNKWMRAGYGEATRKFLLEKTNPIILIDFGGIKVFETATVDVNILLYVKEKSTFNTLACTVKDKELKELSLYVRQHAKPTRFDCAESWVILSDIEQRIKAKIEAIGTPLKDWDIQINYGIKTGFNDAFIIDGEKRAELIAKDPKSAEIIRPILRGCDIKRYSYEFNDKYLICTFPSLKIDIEQYPAVKGFLEGFKAKLKQTGEILSKSEINNIIGYAKNHNIEVKEKDLLTSRKKTKNKWFETQDSINYWEDFSKQKIIYPDISEKLNFQIIEEEIYFNNTIYFITSETEDLDYLLKFLNSNLIDWYYKTLSVQLGEKAVRMFTIYVLNIPIPNDRNRDNIYDSYQLTEEEKTFIENLYCS